MVVQFSGLQRHIPDGVVHPTVVKLSIFVDRLFSTPRPPCSYRTLSNELEICVRVGGGGGWSKKDVDRLCWRIRLAGRQIEVKNSVLSPSQKLLTADHQSLRLKLRSIINRNLIDWMIKCWCFVYLRVIYELTCRPSTMLLLVLMQLIREEKLIQLKELMQQYLLMYVEKWRK